MSDYKRFTEKRNGKNVIPLRNSVCGVGLPKWSIEKHSDIQSFLMGDAVDCFAELEDKIEQGTLIELPCKVGDTVYWLIANKYIIECVVSLINISVGKKTHFTVWAKQKCEGVENDFSSDDLGEEWFVTREEAEKRLKELQE